LPDDILTVSSNKVKVRNLNILLFWMW
jgi:hypothetical protein